MNLKIDLKDPKYCDGCPCNHGMFLPKYCSKGYWEDWEGNTTLEFSYIRPQRCIEENGE